MVLRKIQRFTASAKHSSRITGICNDVSSWSDKHDIGSAADCSTNEISLAFSDLRIVGFTSKSNFIQFLLSLCALNHLINSFEDFVQCQFIFFSFELFVVFELFFEDTADIATNFMAYIKVNIPPCPSNTPNSAWLSPISAL